MDLGNLISGVSFLSSIALILGAVFVVIQIRLNNKTTNMNLIMRVYESANTAEFQSAWLTVLNANITSYAEFEKLPRPEQLAFHQIAALYESLGVLVQRGIVRLDIIEDMFLTELVANYETSHLRNSTKIWRRKGHWSGVRKIIQYNHRLVRLLASYSTNEWFCERSEQR